MAELSVPDDDGLVSKILAFGGGVKVISPEVLREKVKAAALRIAEGRVTAETCGNCAICAGFL